MQLTQKSPSTIHAVELSNKQKIKSPFDDL